MVQKLLSIVALGLLGLVGCQAPTYAPYGSCGSTHYGAPYHGGTPYHGGAVYHGPSQPQGFSLFGPLVDHPKLAAGQGSKPLQYVYNLGVSGSQLSNTLLGGDPDESLSSRFGRAEANGNAVVKYGIAPTVDFFLGPDHCQHAASLASAPKREVWNWGGAGQQGGAGQLNANPQIARGMPDGRPTQVARRPAPVVDAESLPPCVR